MSGDPAKTGRPGWRRDLFLQAGFLVGAAVGAAVTVAGRRAEESARRGGLIDWQAAERVAAARVRNAPGTLDPLELRRAEPIYASAMREIVPALSKALGTELPGVVERSGVVDRADWVHANVSAFSALMGKVEGNLLDQILPPGSGLVKATMAIANRMVTTRQVGYLLGFLGQRVLGQYDIALLSAETTPGRLLFVDENIRRTAVSLGVPLNPFRTWIALHETTHAKLAGRAKYIPRKIGSHIPNQCLHRKRGEEMIPNSADLRVRTRPAPHRQDQRPCETSR